jgi:chlorobactene glucosyltransferase
MQHFKLDMLSAFPQQVTKTWLEKLIVPNIYMTVYSYLPLRLTFVTRFPSIAAANGQWLAVTKQAYHTLGGHKAVRTQVVEDTEMARLAKRKKMKILTTPGRDAVFSRMYDSAKGVWIGFSKNAFGLMDYRLIPFIILLILMLLAYVFPYILIFLPAWRLWGAVGIAGNCLLRFMLWALFRQAPEMIVLAPAGILATITLSINSIRSFYKGDIQWKGRSVPFPEHGRKG